MCKTQVVTEPRRVAHTRTGRYAAWKSIWNEMKAPSR